MTHHSEVVGSLLRPTYLADARKQYEAGQLNAAEFKAIEDRAVNEAIALQETAGIDVITDGEMRRYAFYGHLIEALEGFDKLGGWAIPFRDETGEELVFKRPVVVERLQWKRSMCAEEWVYLRSRKGRPGKVTMISAQQAAAYYDPEKSKAAYASRDAYLADIVDFSRHEVEELIRLGCTYIQIDAPQYAALLDPQMREGYRQRGSDPDKLIDRCIELDNAIISGHPRHVLGDRFVVLGLVTTKKPQLETADELLRRIEEAARFVPLERLALSPQCGFASTMEGNRITPEDQRRKLELVASVARKVWGT